MTWKKIRIDLDKEDYLWLERKARRENRPISSVLRDALIELGMPKDPDAREWVNRRRSSDSAKTTDGRGTRLFGRPSQTTSRPAASHPTRRRTK
jgi:hypothetical protein